MIKVYLNEHDEKGNRTGKQVIVDVKVVQEKPSLLVQLPNGHIILRKRKHIVTE